MNPEILLAASLGRFRHDEGWLGQLIQIFAGLAVWSVLTYVPLKLILVFYEAGKGEEQSREVDQEEQSDRPTRMGWYRITFCLRLSFTLAFVIEGFRFGSGFPSLLLFALAACAWYSLSPARQWMRHSR